MINKVGNTYDDIRRFEDDFRLIIYALYKCNDVRRRIEFFLFAHSSRGKYDIVVEWSIFYQVHQSNVIVRI